MRPQHPPRRESDISGISCTNILPAKSLVIKNISSICLGHDYESSKFSSNTVQPVPSGTLHKSERKLGPFVSHRLHACVLELHWVDNMTVF